MYLIYVDESGDTGFPPASRTNYFVISAIVMHEESWRATLKELVDFRRALKKTTSLKLNEEIHSAAFLNDPGPVKRIYRNVRLNILKNCLTWLSLRPEITVITVVVDKSKHTPQDDLFEIAWKTMLQRCENTLSYKNFPNQNNRTERAMIICDDTNGGKLTQIMRKMRHYNMVPHKPPYGPGSRNMPVQYVIEDPVLRQSKYSLMHQMADVVAYFAHQLYKPNVYVQKQGARRYYGRLGAAINKVAASGNEANFHIVVR